MRPAIQIDHNCLPDPDAVAATRALSACRHSLPKADVRYWDTPNWQVLEQGYDLPDVYVSYLEITATSDAAIPIHCPLHDLYAFYVLEGAVQITGSSHSAEVLRTAAGYYRLSYLPAAAYRCHFQKGTHRIFYLVAKGSVLFREPSPELAGGIGPIEALRAKLGAPSISVNLPLAGLAGASIGRFLRRPGATYLRRYMAIHTLLMVLLFEACNQLRVHDDRGTVGAALAKRIRNHIDEHVADGEEISAASVALRFAVSYAYAKTVFKTYSGQPIGGYIRTRKLEQARRMLKAGEPPTQVARYLCWSYGHFNKAFKARYGVSPKKYR